MLFAANMDLEECPLSKEELLRLVEEEAALRISASFLEQVGQGVVSNTFIISKSHFLFYDFHNYIWVKVFIYFP